MSQQMFHCQELAVVLLAIKKGPDQFLQEVDMACHCQLTILTIAAVDLGHQCPVVEILPWKVAKQNPGGPSKWGLPLDHCHQNQHQAQLC